MLEDEQSKAERREARKKKGGVSFGVDRTALLHNDGSIEPLLEEVDVAEEVETEEYAKASAASANGDSDIDPDDVAVAGVDEEVASNASSSSGTDFFPSSGFIGTYDGMYYGTGRRGTGYYRDADNGAAAEVEPTARSRFYGRRCKCLLWAAMGHRGGDHRAGIPVAQEKAPGWRQGLQARLEERPNLLLRFPPPELCFQWRHTGRESWATDRHRRSRPGRGGRRGLLRRGLRVTAASRPRGTDRCR